MKKIFLFSCVYSVAIRLDRSDIIDWLVKEVQENPTQLDIRVKKYVKYSTFK